MDWVEYEYDSQTKRIWKVKHNGITAMTYAYSNPSSTGIPLKVTTTYESPALPPMSSIVDEFGDPTSIDQVGGIAMVREINPSLRRVEKITGFSTITPRYNLNGSPNHWRLDAISSNIQELEILRPNPLTTQYSYKGAKDDPSSRPSISETVIKNNGVLDQHTRQNIPIISNYNPASQP